MIEAMVAGKLRPMPFDLSLTEEQNALVDTAREFAKKEIIPVAGKLDEHGTFPKEILEKAWGVGLTNIEIPEAFGGVGLNCLEHCLVLEEIAYACAGVNTLMAANTPGVRVGKKEDKMGQRCSNTSDVIFEDVKLPKSALVGEEGGGFKIAMKTFDRSRPWIAAGAAGIIRRSLEESRNYSLERKTF